MNTTQIIHKSQPRITLQKTSDGWLFSTRRRGHGSVGQWVRTARERDMVIKGIRLLTARGAA